jgi:hypothetical protein
MNRCWNHEKEPRVKHGAKNRQLCLERQRVLIGKKKL